MLILLLHADSISQTFHPDCSEEAIKSYQSTIARSEALLKAKVSSYDDVTIPHTEHDSDSGDDTTLSCSCATHFMPPEIPGQVIRKNKKYMA
jgi:hypothetical protein